MLSLFTERMFRRALVAVALTALLLGMLAWVNGKIELANWCWAGDTVPVIAGLLISMMRDFLSGWFGGGLGCLCIDVGRSCARSEFGRCRCRHHVCGWPPFLTEPAQRGAHQVSW